MLLLILLASVWAVRNTYHVQKEYNSTPYMYITILEEIELNFYFPFEKRDRISAYFSITFRLLQCNTITFIHAQGSKIGTTVNRNIKKCLLVGPIRLPLMNRLSVKCVK